MVEVQTNFTADSFVGSKKADAKAAPKPKVKEQSSSNEVPEGTSTEVLDWVGDNPARARKALAAEKKDDNPRVTVTDELERVLEHDKAKKKAEKKSE